MEPALDQGTGTCVVGVAVQVVVGSDDSGGGSGRQRTTGSELEGGEGGKGFGTCDRK